MGAGHQIIESNRCSFVKEPPGSVTGWLSHPIAKMVDMNRQHDIHHERERHSIRGDTLVIDCATCSQRDTSTCDNCMVTFLCDREPGDAVVVDLGEFRAMWVLGESGLVPPLRHSEQT